jgi:hypothetical protein
MYSLGISLTKTPFNAHPSSFPFALYHHTYHRDYLNIHTFTIFFFTRCPRLSIHTSFFFLSQSHRPSFHPVLHLSCHLLQSNVSLPSLTLTALCARHSQVPKASRPDTGSGSRAMCAWKSSAHTQHGYSREKADMKVRRSACSRAEGSAGYVAAIECSSVQVERPSCSTSGGQSRGMVRVAAAPVVATAAAAVAVAVEEKFWLVVVVLGFNEDLAKALKADPEEQVRQLGERYCQSRLPSLYERLAKERGQVICELTACHPCPARRPEEVRQSLWLRRRARRSRLS